MVAVEVGVGFELDCREVNKADLRLNIGAFVVIYFDFTSTSFSRFFSH